MTNFVQRLLLSIFLAPIVLIFIYLGGLYFKILFIFVLLLGLYEIFNLNNNYVRFLVLFLFSLFLFCFYELRFSNNGEAKILLCLLITWFSDIGGYLFGKIIGGKKINVISPNKTFSGFVGSLFLPQMLLIYYINKNYLISNNLFSSFLMILMLSISAILGDLFFSYLKRLMSIKDYSKLLIGHGGLFDRIDSLIFVTIFFFFY